MQSDRPIWSSIFQWTDKTNVTSLTASHPIYDASRQIIGVLSTDLVLSQINDFLQQVSISSASRTFIVERNGLIVANSENLANYQVEDNTAQRLMASIVSDPFIQATATYLIQHFGSFKEISTAQNLHFQMNNQRQFVYVSPWKDPNGLDWLIVVTVPEADFMEQIYHNTRITTLLCLAALGVAMLTGIFTVRWVSLPILRLNNAAKALANSAYRFVLSGGTVRWGYGQALPEKDMDGDITGYVGTITDISAQKQIEEALRQSEAQFHRLAENIPGVIYRYVLHPDGNHEFTYASPGTIDLYGYTPEALMQNPQLAWQQTHPDDIEPLNSAIQISAKTMQPWQWEGRVISLSGEQKWVKGISRPERQPNGDIVWDGLLMDISDRKQAEYLLAEYSSNLEHQVYERTIALQQEIYERGRVESELREQQAFLRQVIDVAPSAIFVKDQQGRFLCVNQAAAAMYGASVDTMIGKSDFNFSVEPEQVQKFLANNQQVMTTRQSKFISAEAVLTCQGELRWYQTIINPLIDAQEQVQGIVGAATDITDLKQVEEELRQAKEAAESANRAKSTFLANMSHELRTPLNAILGFSQLMSDDTNLSLEQQETLEVIYRSGEHLLILINQVLDLSKIEAGSMTLHEKTFDLHQLLIDVQRMFSLKAHEKGLQLNIHYENNVPHFIRTDDVKLRQVLINLISNAIKFTFVGSVSVRVRSYADSALFLMSKNQPMEPGEQPARCILIFDVIDTGIGIAVHELELLFKPFVQTSSGQQFQEGTGLGLSISYQFVRLMAGEMLVSSQGCTFAPEVITFLCSDIMTDLPSEGTAFCFAIPVTITDASSIAETKGTNSTNFSFGGPNLKSFNPTDALNRTSFENVSLENISFENVSQDWLIQFRLAILEGDLEYTNELVARLASSHEQLAVILKSLVNQYRFEQILQLISNFIV